MNKRLCSRHLDVMNFLNEVVETYPEAISFASGRPSTEFFNLSHYVSSLGLESTVPHEVFQKDNSCSKEILAQYGKTGGLFNKHISRYLKKDEDFDAQEGDIVVTNGCQEALSLCVDALFNQGDVLLTLDPTYIGIIGVCQIRGVEVDSICSDTAEILLVELERKIISAKREGKNIRAIYLTPDFSNPMGDLMTLDQRVQILNFCSKNAISIFEDSAYRYFNYENDIPPIMAQLDQKGVVYHIGSFSKTVCPGLRIGYVVCSSEHGHSALAVENLCRVKSFTTLNTPPLTQVIVASILARYRYSLRAFVAPALQFYKDNRDCLVAALSDCFDEVYRKDKGVSWTEPEGGFFLTIKVPFVFNMSEAEHCAREFGVICVPVSIFSLANAYENIIRVSFSYVQQEQIQEGCLRLSHYIKAAID